MTGCYHLHVAFVSDSAAYASGNAARPLLVSLKGRLPMWSSTRRAFAIQPSTARDLLALADQRRVTTSVEHYQQQELF